MNPIRLHLPDLPPEQRRLLQKLQYTKQGEVAVEFEKTTTTDAWVKLVSTKDWFGMEEWEWLQQRKEENYIYYMPFPPIRDLTDSVIFENPGIYFDVGALHRDAYPALKSNLMPQDVVDTRDEDPAMGNCLQPGIAERVRQQRDASNDPAFARRGVCSYCGMINEEHLEGCVHDLTKSVEIREPEPEPWERVLHDCWSYYNAGAGRPTGYNLHVVLDDGNMERRHINWSLGYCDALGDEAGASICTKLLAMKKEQRLTLYDNYHRYAWRAPEPPSYKPQEKK